MRAVLFTSLVIVAAASGAVDERADLRALQEATTTATTTPHPLRDMYENMMQWWCSKPDNGESVVCKRRQLVGLLRSSPEKKSETLDALKKLGAPPSGAVRAVQDEYCRVPENASTSVCKNHGLAEEGKKMAEWFCSQEGKEATLYCQRSKLMLKMRTIPPDGAPSARKDIYMELSTLMKGKSFEFMEQSKNAKKAYCAQPGVSEKYYCNIPKIKKPTMRVAGSRLPTATGASALASAH